MTESPGTPDAAPAAFVSDADEISLAEARSTVGPDAVPDTLEVRSDSIEVLQNSMERFRRPVVIAVAAAAAGVALLVAAGFIRRLGQRDVSPPA